MPSQKSYPQYTVVTKTQQCVLAEWMNGRSCCRGSDQRQRRGSGVSIIKSMHSFCVSTRSLLLDRCLLSWLTAPGSNGTQDYAAVDANGLFSSCLAEILITVFIIGPDITQSMGSSWIVKHFIKPPQTNDHTTLKSSGSWRAASILFNYSATTHCSPWWC